MSDSTRRGWIDRILMRTPPPDWPTIGNDWEERYPALTAAGVRPWDNPDMERLDEQIADLVRFAVAAERDRIRARLEALRHKPGWCREDGWDNVLDDALAALDDDA